MGKERVTREKLERDLEAMRRNLEQLEACRIEFQSIQRKYEELLASAPDAMIFVDRGGRIVLHNAQTERLFGYSREELSGSDVSRLIPERFHDRHAKFIADYFERPKVRRMGSGLRISGRKKNGEEFPADISLSPLHTDEGLFATAAVRDITERVMTQERVERNYLMQKAVSSVLELSLKPVSLEEQIDGALDIILSIPALALQEKGAVYLSVEGKLVMQARRGISAAQQSTCGSIPFGKCLCGQAAQQCQILYADCVDDRHEVTFEEIPAHGHYCVPISSSGNVLGLINVFLKEGHARREEEEEFLTVIANTLAGVIERYRYRAEEQRLRNRLAENEKLAALGRLSSNVAHEIRNPLTAVGGFTRRLQRRIAEGTKEWDYTELILSEVYELERVLKNVLAYSRTAVPDVEVTDMVEVVEGVVKTVEGEADRRSIRLERHYGQVPLMRVDREQVAEAVGNLVSNAFDAMPRGGTVTVSVSEEAVHGVRYVVVRVKDMGEGIPRDKIGTIFEPFYSTKVAAKGIGLGLPLSKKVVEDHDGFMEVKSEVGAGSTFSLFFPASAPTGESTAADG